VSRPEGVGTDFGTQFSGTGCQRLGSVGTAEAKSADKSMPDGIAWVGSGPLQRFRKPQLSGFRLARRSASALLTSFGPARREATVLLSALTGDLPIGFIFRVALSNLSISSRFFAQWSGVDGADSQALRAGR
jgi:hypothetical protein